MMRKIYLPIVLIAACACLSHLIPASPRDSTAQAAVTAGLEDTLMNGLLARTPNDRAFVKKTVLSVKQNKLSRKMVMETFQYVRKKISSKRRATIFQLLLRRRAKAVGVKI